MAVNNPRVLAPFFEFNVGRVSLGASDPKTILEANADRVYVKFTAATGVAGEIFLTPGPGGTQDTAIILDSNNITAEFAYRDIGPIVGNEWTAAPDFSTPDVLYFEVLYRPRELDQTQLELEEPREAFG